MTPDDVTSRLHDVLVGRPEVRFALLFGSVLRDPARARDVDVAVSFSHPVPLFERARLALDLETAIERPVDLVDLADASTLLKWEIVNGYRVITSLDRPSLVTFLARAPLEYFELEPFFKLETRGLRAALQKAAWSTGT